MEKIENLISLFKDDFSKAKFLCNVYSPGESAVAEKILEYNHRFRVMETLNGYNHPVADIIKAEAEFHLKAKNDHEFMKFAKILIDMDQKKYNIIGLLEQWNNKELIDYTFDFFLKKEYFWSCAELAKLSEKNDLRKECLEKVLAEYLDPDYPKNNTVSWKSNRLDCLIELEKYDEFSEMFFDEHRYNKDDDKVFPGIYCAGEIIKYLDIFEKKLPSIAKQAYEKVFNAIISKQYYMSHGFFMAFAKSAKKLGKGDEAIEFIANKEINRDCISSTDSNGLPLILESINEISPNKALEILNLVTNAAIQRKTKLYEAKTIVECAKNFNSPELVYKIYNFMDEKYQNYGKEYDLDAEFFMMAHKATKDDKFLELAVPLFLKSEDYDSAIKAANLLKESDLSQRIFEAKSMVLKYKINRIMEEDNK
ncbi:MAG: hypothetical protein PHN56_04465 [Candidatus Nanoarchaeia archaeon]|nr:hypothetical protein [Candidatus Nanoarchaeia archaeon]